MINPETRCRSEVTKGGADFCSPCENLYRYSFMQHATCYVGQPANIIWDSLTHWRFCASIMTFLRMWCMAIFPHAMMPSIPTRCSVCCKRTCAKVVTETQPATMGIHTGAATTFECFREHPSSWTFLCPCPYDRAANDSKVANADYQDFHPVCHAWLC